MVRSFTKLDDTESITDTSSSGILGEVLGEPQKI